MGLVSETASIWKERMVGGPADVLPPAARDGPGDAAGAALREQIRRLKGREGGDGGIDLRPASAYEAVTRQMVETLTDELREIKLRLNNLIFMLAGAIVLDVMIRLIAP